MLNLLTAFGKMIQDPTFLDDILLAGTLNNTNPDPPFDAMFPLISAAVAARGLPKLGIFEIAELARQRDAKTNVAFPGPPVIAQGTPIRTIVGQINTLLTNAGL